MKLLSLHSFGAINSACKKPGLIAGLLFCLLTSISMAVRAQTPMFSKGGSTGTQTIPLSQASQKTQILYAPGDLSPAPTSGQITKIYFRNVAASATASYENFKVSFTQPNFSIFPNNTYLTNLFVAKYEPTITLNGNGTVGGWFEIPLNTPFQYDHTKSLVVEIEYSALTSGSLSTYSASAGTGNNKRISGQVLSATTGTLSTTWNDFGIDVEPSTACSGTPIVGTFVNNPTTPICPNTAVSLFLANTQQGTGVSFNLQSSSALSGPFTDVGTAQANNSWTVNPAVTTYYQAGVSCNGGAFSYSMPIAIKVKQPLNGPYNINAGLATDVVDGGNNFQSFTDVQDYLSCGSISGPVTFNVAVGSGPYTSQLTIGDLTGSSATNQVVINGNGETLQFAPVTSARHIIRLNGTKYVTIRNLILKSTATGFGWGVQLLNGADNNRITHCTIDLSAVTSTSSGASAGVVASASNTSITSGNNANFLSVDSNTIIGGYHGVVLYGNGGANGVGNRVVDNTVMDFYATGVELGNTSGTVVERNDINRAVRQAVTTFAGIVLTAGNTSANINSNRIHDTHTNASTQTGAAYGIYLNDCDAPTDLENRIINNVIYNFNSVTGIQYALYNLGSDGVRYFHNSVSLDYSGSTAGTTRGFFQNNAATNILFLNNNIYIARAGTGEKSAIYLGTPTSSVASNYNNLYIASTQGNNYLGYANGVGHSTLNAWKLNTSLDNNSKSLDPAFTNPSAGDLKPQQNALDNSGTPAGVTTDILGIARNVTTPDIGAYEFDAGPCNTSPNAGSAIISFSPTTICPGSALTLALENNTIGTGQTYVWQSSPTPGTGFTNISTASPNAEVNINATTTLYYRAIVTCSGNADTSTEVQVVVNPALPGGIYTINNLAATAGTNFNSFSDAINAITCGVTSATVFNVEPSTYNEQVIIPDIPGMSATNTITFNGNRAVIDFLSSNTAERATVKLNGSKYITFDNFIINANGNATTEYGFGVQLLNDADNNTVSNCSINVTASPATASSTSFAGIVISGSPGNAIGTLSNCDGNTIHNNTINGGFYSITLMGGTTPATYVNNNSITSNIITDFHSYGIYIGGANNTLVEKNDISRPTRSNGAIYRGVQLEGSSQNVQISKNKFHDPFAAAITSTQAANAVYFNNANATAGNENIVSNNLIYKFENNGPHIGFNNQGSSFVKYFHNTVDFDHVSGGTTQYATWGLYLGWSTAPTGIEFINNIISITRSGNYSKYAYQLQSTDVSLQADNNVVYINAPGGVSAIGNIGSTAYTTFAQWQAANNNTYDQQSKNVDPLYANKAGDDYTPTEALINNIGANVGIATDINNVTRNIPAPDPGAFEFGNIPCITPPTPGTIVLTPNTPVCPGTATTLNLVGHDVATGVTYQWQSSANINGPYTNESGLLANPEFNFSAPALSRYYRVAVTCSGVTSYSDTVQVVVPVLISGSFTIDAGQTTGNGIFQSFADAINHIKCGINGPVVFNVVPGTYNEQVVMPSINGASAANTITFNGNGATVFSSPSSTAPVGFMLDGADFVVLDSLVINVSTGAYGTGILLTNQADSNIIRRCTVLTNNNTSSNPIRYFGISINGSTSSSTPGNNGNGNLITGNTVDGGYYGITIYGGGNSLPANTGNKVINNKVTDTYVAPVYVAFQSGAVVSGNDVSRPTRPNSSSTVYGIYLFNGNADILAEKNRVHNMFDAHTGNTGTFHGIYSSSSVATAGYTIRIVNNMVYNIYQEGVVNGIYNSGSSYNDIYHNTLVLDGSSSTGALTHGFYQTGSATNINFKNNIVYITRGGSGAKYGIYKNTAANVISSNGNVFFINTGTNDYIGFQTTAHATLTDWQTATGQDGASIVADPQFLNPGGSDFTPINSTINGASLNSTSVGVGQDIFGVPRNSNPDPGAIEFWTTTYTFIGNGNWNNPANWVNGAIPPSPLPAESEVIIDPSGVAILNVPFIVNANARLSVKAGKQLIVPGNLTIQ